MYRNKFRETIEVSKVRSKMVEVVRAMTGDSNDEQVLEGIPYVGDEPAKKKVPIQTQKSSRGLGILSSARPAAN